MNPSSFGVDDRPFVSDGGTELTETTVPHCRERRIDWRDIASGKPVRHAFIESVNGRPFGPFRWLPTQTPSPPPSDVGIKRQSR